MDLSEMPLGAYGDALGLTFERMDEDGIVATWEATPALHQPYGIVHGGVHATVVETLGSISGALWLGAKGKVVGVNNNTDFFRAVSEGTLRSVSTPLHRGRSQQVWIIETTDDQGRLVSRGQLRLQNLYPDT
jgi:1,4-dihydroxy-2-naphthoyl-CoA hydrolase